VTLDLCSANIIGLIETDKIAIKFKEEIQKPIHVENLSSTNGWTPHQASAERKSDC